MKKAIIIIVILVAGISIYFMFGNSSVNKTGTPTVNSDGNFHPDPSNATFTFDDGPVTLSRGKNEAAITPGSALTEETDLMDKFAYGDINQDGKNDTALLLAQYGGGSGVFIYMAVYVSGPVNYKGSEAVFIGDRIAPQSISIDGNVISVKYLDRGPDDPFSTEPTIPVTRQFVYKNGAFQ